MDLVRIAARVAARKTAATPVPSDTMVTFHVAEGSPLATDTDGELGIAFSNLVEQAGMEVEWGTDAFNVTIPAGEDDVFLKLVSEIKAGQHGPEAQAALSSLESPGEVKLQVNGVWTPSQDESDYYLS